MDHYPPDKTELSSLLLCFLMKAEVPIDPNGQVFAPGSLTDWMNLGETTLKFRLWFVHRARSRPTPANQVQPGAVFPNGSEKTIAVLDLGPAELTIRYGLRFARVINHLGPYDYRVIELEPGVQAWFGKHDPDAHPEISVHVDAQADSGRLLPLALNALTMDPASVIWAADPSAGRRVLA